MTLEMQITEALGRHQYRGRGRCRCGWNAVSKDSFEWIPAHERHVASVVAALPNIAVIEVPEGENRWHVTDWDGGRVSLCYGVDTVRCYLPNPALEVVEAEELGIALIAASRQLATARAAGGQVMRDGGHRDVCSTHDFLPVAGHPDDDECTHRTDGTDATYCGLSKSEHDA